MTHESREVPRPRRTPTAGEATAGLMSVCYAVALFHRTAYQAIDPALRAEFALSAAESADLAATFFWTYLVAMIPVGLAADAFGARRLAVGGSLVVAGGALVFFSAGTYAELVVARMVLAVGSAAAFVALMRFVALNFPDRKASYSGRGILVGNLGAIASGAPLAMLLASTSWRMVWLALALLSLGLAAVLMRIAPRATSAHTGPARARDARAELRALLRSPAMWLGIALQAGLAGAFYAYTNLIAPRWLAAHGLDPLEAGWAVSALIVGYGTGAAFWGWLGDAERKRARALVLACCMTLLCWTTLAFDPWGSPPVIAAYLFITGLSCGAFVLIYALVAELHPPSEAGGVIACANWGIPLGAALIQTLAGRVPPDLAPLLLVAAYALAAGCALRLLRARSALVRGAVA